MKINDYSEHYTYIAECSDGTYYVGKTTDLTYRFLQHNGKKSGGGKYTRARRPVVLKYFERHTSNSMACQREAFLKKLTHSQKEELIQSNPQDIQETNHL